MTPRLWLALGAVCIIPLRARDVAAQSTAHPDSANTKHGVYTAAQAARGRDIYLGNCRSCHTAETHTGETFNAIWNHRPLAELYAYISERMPKNDPGSLSPQEYADVLAYVLRMNRLPAGAAELVPDSLALSHIRIEIDKPSP